MNPNFLFNQDSLWKQILTFVSLMLLFAIAFSGVSMVISIVIYGKDLSTTFQIGDPNSHAAMRIIQTGSHLGLFLVPALFYAYLTSSSIHNYYQINKKPDIQQLIMALFLLILSLPFIGILYEWNMKMVLPDFLKSVENWMIESEKNAKEVTEALLSTDRFGTFFFNLFTFAILPAIGEELVFRGFLMKAFAKKIRNIHLNIFLVSLLFSALHLQFFGFLPRLFLGILLGYLYFWSKNLWIPIFIHFLNNGLTVTVYYLFNAQLIHSNPDTIGSNTPYYIYLINLLAIVGIVFWFTKKQSSRALFTD
ncbi:MAG: CPBP family intramembrane metalloprotease [Bacteroidales bacterium]|nr:CPBP family intramembrane metalloprotease [Bacteroidales bacterium]